MCCRIPEYRGWLHQFPVAVVVVGVVVTALVVVVLVVVAVVLVVVVIVVADDVVFAVQDAKTRDATIRKVNANQVVILFTQFSFFIKLHLNIRTG